MSGPRQILHVDMDAFYAAVEQRDDPSLRGRPVLVGGRSLRSVVCTASYEARPSGARSAMPMAEALRRCPDAVVVRPRIAHYAEVSRQIFAILRRYTPLVEGLSLDEAFLDVSRSQGLFGDGRAIAERIREDIRASTGLTASAGVATCKLIAKIASDQRKPDGLTVVAPGEERRFLAPLPIERMWGIGPKAAEAARQVGLRTIGDLASASASRLERVFGKSFGPAVSELARGIDPREVQPDRAAKSVGAEETFELDLTTREQLEAALLEQSARVARRLAAEGLAGEVVVLKIKLADFQLYTRRKTLQEPVGDTLAIHRAACELLAGLSLEGRRVRLTGVSVSGLSAEAERPRGLFPDVDAERRRRLEQVALAASTRFGEGALVRAGTLSSPSRLSGRSVAEGSGRAIAPARDDEG